MRWLSLSHPTRFEQHAFTVTRLSLDSPLEHGIKIIQGHAGEKAQASQIYGQNGNLAFAHQASGCKQRAVAFEHDQEISKRGDFFASLYVAGRGDTLGGLSIAENINAPLFEPCDQSRGNRRDIPSARPRK